MSLLVFYSSLRKDLISIIRGVEDSSNSLSWDHTTPNYITKSKLEKLYKKFVSQASEFGFYIVNRHAECGRPNHKSINKYGYVMDKINDEIVLYKGKDSQYVWRGNINQGEKIMICACSRKSKPIKHYVLEEVLFDINADIEVCKIIERIFTEVNQAIVSSSDGAARSSIREHLLRVILYINDALLPIPMNEYIAKQLQLNKA